MPSIYTSTDLSWLWNLTGRNSDGTGNNIGNTDWGSPGTLYRRITTDSYVPDANGDRTGIDPTLPTVAAVSDAIFDLLPDEQHKPSQAGHNENIVFFGQLLTHDMVFTAPGGGPFPDATFPFFFGRNGFVVEDGVAQQSNTRTSFLDLSMVYGISNAQTDQLSDGGRMILGPDGLLPTASEIADNAGLTGPFFTGDLRANQTPQLLSQQMIWARNHNWHADELEAKYGDSWTDAQVFNAARALNEAEWQNVVYNEYLKTLFGANALDKYSGYKAYVDPSIINEFTAVANRFGHDQTSNAHALQNEDGSIVDIRKLAQAFNDVGGATSLADSSAELDLWIRGQLSQSSQDTDGKVTDGPREELFGIPGVRLDLESIDVGRGRDHGAGDYNALREGLGLKTYASFDKFAKANKLGASDTTKLKELYGDDIGQLDSIVGALLEKDAKGSTMGETITVLHVLQFEALRDGDRFYFENRFKGNADLIAEIKETSLADIIGRNTGLDHVYHDAFAAHERIGGDDYANTLSGTKKGDLVIGFDGDDFLFGKQGDDDVYGGKGKDALNGWFGVDRLHGDAGKDTLRGEEDGDHLYGGTGDDISYGGAGRDTHHFEAYSGYDVIKDFSLSQDKIDLSDVYGLYNLAAVKGAAYQSGKHTYIELGEYDVLALENVKLSQLKSQHFDYSDQYLTV